MKVTLPETLLPGSGGLTDPAAGCLTVDEALALTQTEATAFNGDWMQERMRGLRALLTLDQERGAAVARELMKDPMMHTPVLGTLRACAPELFEELRAHPGVPEAWRSCDISDRITH